MTTTNNNWQIGLKENTLIQRNIGGHYSASSMVSVDMSTRAGLLQATKIQREKAAMDIITIITRAGDRATRFVLSRFVFWTFWQFQPSGPSQEEEEGKSRRYREVGKLMIYMNVGTFCMDMASLNTVHQRRRTLGKAHFMFIAVCSDKICLCCQLI